MCKMELWNFADFFSRVKKKRFCMQRIWPAHNTNGMLSTLKYVCQGQTPFFFIHSLPGCTGSGAALEGEQGKGDPALTVSSPARQSCGVLT